MLHAAPSAGPKRVRPSKTQKAASQASQASLESHHTALASWEGAVPACGAVGGGALPASAWASGWGASGPCAAAAPGSALASAPASAPALASPAMYAGMWSGMGGGEVLAMQQHMSMVQHPQALAKVCLPAPSSLAYSPELPCPCHAVHAPAVKQPYLFMCLPLALWSHRLHWHTAVGEATVTAGLQPPDSNAIRCGARLPERLERKRARKLLVPAPLPRAMAGAQWLAMMMTGRKL